MKRIYLLLFLVGVTISCKHENEQIKNNMEVSLNGTWHFMASNTVSENEVLTADYASWGRLAVPGNWDTQNEHAHFVGKGYYQRNIEIPNTWKGKQIRVKFDAVYETSKVWLNGVLLGIHKGGYTPFEFNISKQVNYGGENSLVVMADNSFKRGAWWAWGGISRNVSLFINDEVRLVRQHISAVPDFENKVVDFKIEYKIENNGSQGVTVNLVSTIKNSNDEEWLTKNHSFKINSNTISKTEINFSQSMEKVDLWHFDRPNLYSLKTDILIDDRLRDSGIDKFGIRKLEVRGEQLFLNNEAIRVNGFNRVHDHRLYGNSEPYELIEKDILDIKSLGGNFSRIMHAPASKSLVKFCDSIGYMLIEEIPVWGRGAPNATANNPITKQWLTEMIERDYNHASVVGWSVGNEIGNLDCEWEDMTMTADQFNYVNSMFDHVSTLDKTRLKTYASFTSYLPKSDISNEPIEKADFISINTYGDHLKKVTETHQKFPGKPIFFSEIGKGQIGSDADAVLDDELIDEMIRINELPYVIGTALWTYNDYRSNYKNTPASENRAWGVVDVWRNPKAAYKQIQEVYAPIEDMECKLTDNMAEVIIKPRSKNVSPSYILQQYTLKIDFLNGDNETIDSEIIKLPSIAPGDKQLLFKIRNKNGALSIKSSLISPVNIDMYTREFPVRKTKKMVDDSLGSKIIFLKKYRKNITVGYTVKDEDSLFVFKYGDNPKELTDKFETELKGSVTIPWDSMDPFYIQVKSDNSEWSEIEKLK